MLTTLLCGCSNDYIDSEVLDMAKIGFKELHNYYEPHCLYEQIECRTKDTYNKKYKDENLLTNLQFESVIYARVPGGKLHAIIIHCHEEHETIEIQKKLNYYSFDSTNLDTYMITNNYVYFDSKLSYLFLLGVPLEKDGFLYYELENNETLLFG